MWDVRLKITLKWCFQFFMERKKWLRNLNGMLKVFVERVITLKQFASLKKGSVHRWHVEQRLQLFNDLTQISNIIIDKRLSCKATFTTRFLLLLMPINFNDCPTKLFVYHWNLCAKHSELLRLFRQTTKELKSSLGRAFKMHTGNFTIQIKANFCRRKLKIYHDFLDHGSMKIQRMETRVERRLCSNFEVGFVNFCT